MNSIMTDVWDDEDLLLDYVDALDRPACPRCRSAVFEHDKELRAHICDDCGLWLDDEPDDYL